MSERAGLDFSKREKWFAEKIFKPFLEEKKRLFEYDKNLYYFLTSLLWRGLLSELENRDYVKEKYYGSLLEVEREWKDYLRGGATPVKFSDVNLFLTDSIRAHNINVTGLDYYITRTLDFTIFASSDGSFVAIYCKFLRFMVWSVIKDIHTNINSELQIRPSLGFIHFPQHIHDAYMIENVIQRVRVIESIPGASEHQQEKIFQEVKKNTRKFINSDAARAIFNDLNNLDQS